MDGLKTGKSSDNEIEEKKTTKERGDIEREIERERRATCQVVKDTHLWTDRLGGAEVSARGESGSPSGDRLELVDGAGRRVSAADEGACVRRSQRKSSAGTSSSSDRHTMQRPGGALVDWRWC